MAVITRYVVVRNGVELDRVFEVKKEAEAFDKMLDAADQLAQFIKDGALDVPLDESTIEAISIFLAKNGPEVTNILKGIRPLARPAKAQEDPAEKTGPEKEAKKPARTPSGRKGK